MYYLVSVDHNSITAHLTGSDSEGLGAVCPMQWMGTICCGMAVKRIRMLGVSARKIKALTVKMKKVAV